METQSYMSPYFHCTILIGFVYVCYIKVASFNVKIVFSK